MKFEFNGFDELEKNLNSISENAEKIDGDNDIPIEELFTDKFMQEYTNFSSISKFVDHSPFDFSDLDSIPENKLDKYVSEHSSFLNWNDMLARAEGIWVTKNLGL